jgi:hypothetical protein
MVVSGGSVAGGSVAGGAVVVGGLVVVVVLGGLVVDVVVVKNVGTVSRATPRVLASAGVRVKPAKNSSRRSETTRATPRLTMSLSCEPTADVLPSVMLAGSLRGDDSPG